MKRLYSVIGMIVPVGFAVSVLILGALTPGYSHVYHTISELGEVGAPYAVEASIVFMVSGGLIIGFGYGLQRSIPRQDSRVLCGVCVIAYGLLDFVGSGLFPVDPGGAATTLSASYHVTLTVLGELAALAMPVVFLVDTENVLGWEPLRRLSKWVGVLLVPASGFLVWAIGGNVPGVNDSPIGLAQRILVGLFLGWIFCAAWFMRKR